MIIVIVVIALSLNYFLLNQVSVVLSVHFTNACSSDVIHKPDPDS